MIEVKIRDHCDTIRYTQIRPTEQIHVYITPSNKTNLFISTPSDKTKSLPSASKMT